MFKRILVATDGSKLSRKAVTSAVSLARAVGASLVGFHARPTYPLAYYGDGALMVPPEAEAEFEKRSETMARKHLGVVEGMAAEAGVPYKGVVAMSDSPADAILAAAKRERCDLIVMASHGRHGMSRLLLGSEANKVLTHATKAVLVTR